MMASSPSQAASATENVATQIKGVFGGIWWSVWLLRKLVDVLWNVVKMGRMKKWWNLEEVELEAEQRSAVFSKNIQLQF